MKTLFNNLKTLLSSDSTLSGYVKWFEIGADTIDSLVAYNRFPFVVIDRTSGTGIEYVPTDIAGLRRKHFYIAIRIAVRLRKKETALLGDEGLLQLTEDVLNAVFGDETVGSRVEELSESITVEEAEIVSGGILIGMARSINLTYTITE